MPTARLVSTLGIFGSFRSERVGPAVMAYAKDAGIEPVAPQVSVLELYDVIRP
jgi:hypothetical protein